MDSAGRVGFTITITPQRARSAPGYEGTHSLRMPRCKQWMPETEKIETCDEYAPLAPLASYNNTNKLQCLVLQINALAWERFAKHRNSDSHDISLS